MTDLATELSHLPARMGDASWPDHEYVAECPRSVEQIAATLPVSRPAVSQHLRVLSAANLVDARREGRCRIYRVRLEGLQGPRAELERFWAQTLENCKQIAEEAST